MFEISNKGQAIASTNYWESEHAANGYFFVSWNAGAARLLVPDSQKAMLRDMRGAREVIISRGPWKNDGRDMLELLFEDDSDEPLVLHIDQQQADRAVPESEQGGMVCAVWTRSGMKLRLPARYRTVAIIPHMQPWSEH